MKNGWEMSEGGVGASRMVQVYNCLQWECSTAWAAGGFGRDSAVAQANFIRFLSFLLRLVAIICTYHCPNLQGMNVPRRNQYV